ncbi:unnamed protein product [Meloidogyne enterolobii]|uniref:Uncharacterized protein n=1 Tax=Meloidogyne enterolobii TaxID=390850 RepID=A0ACB0XZA0_MELEN
MRNSVKHNKQQNKVQEASKDLTSGGGVESSVEPQIQKNEEITKKNTSKGNGKKFNKSEYMKIYRQNNKEKNREYFRNYYKNNKEKWKEYDRKCIQNEEKKRESFRNYYQNNREKKR